MKLSRLKKKIAKAGIDALLVTSKPNVRYLTGIQGMGFTGSGWALVTPERQILLIDFRYYEQANQEVSGWDIVLSEKSHFATLGKVLKKNRIGRIGFETTVSFNHLQELKKRIGKSRLHPKKGWIEELRAIKTEDEIALIKRAAEIADEAFRHALKLIKPGETELDLATELEYFIKKKKADTSFDMILISGERSSLIHGRPGERVLATGDVVLLDLGVNWSGYCSDLTRVVSIGRMSTEQKKVYTTVREIQRNAVGKIKPGVNCRKLYSAVKDMVERAGYYLGHGLGHGLGLEVHESPNIGSGSKDVIRENMVITVEPGIYLRGEFGIRIEDMVLVRRSGAELMTHSPRHIIEL